jgi:hypothetical protein
LSRTRPADPNAESNRHLSALKEAEKVQRELESRLRKQQKKLSL